MRQRSSEAAKREPKVETTECRKGGRVTGRFVTVEDSRAVIIKGDNDIYLLGAKQ